MPDPAVYKLVSPGTNRSMEEQIALLAEVTAGFADSLDVGETLHNAIRRLMDYLDAEAASIFLLENDGRELVCHECAGPVDITGLRLDAGQGIVGKTVRRNACQMVRDVSLDPDFANAVDQGTGFRTRSILCAPLRVRGRCIGALELINKRGGDGLFDDGDQQLLTALASAAALAIHNAQLAAALVEQERLRRELELARKIQEGLLPGVPGEDFPVWGMNIPAMEVSGDFYDFLQLPDGRIYFNLADVSGKGINAALLMAKTSSLLRCLAKSCTDPGELLARVNEEICDNATHGMFVTVVSGFVEPGTGLIRLSNAGHQPALYHHGGGVFEQVPAGAPPLGVLPEAEFPVATLPLDGGSLYLFTDGVTESPGPDDRPLDIPGLMGLIDGMSQLSAVERLQNIVAEIRKPDRSQHDDITLMVIECRNP